MDFDNITETAVQLFEARGAIGKKRKSPKC